MNTAVDDLDDLDQPTLRQREFHLSTGTVLGIFFTLALVCGLFFAFGYTAGRHSMQPAVAGDAQGGASFSSFKPAPGAPAIQAVPGYLSAKDAAQANANQTTQIYAPAAAAQSTPVRTTTPSRTEAQPAVAAAQPVSRQAAEEAPASRPQGAPVAAAAPPAPAPVERAAAPTGPFMVQVAAVSHQEDAEVLLSALKRKGYAVATHTVPTDRLIHVQLGPFGDRHEADTMRQKLLSDGYNAIVK